MQFMKRSKRAFCDDPEMRTWYPFPWIAPLPLLEYISKLVARLITMALPEKLPATSSVMRPSSWKAQFDPAFNTTPVETEMR